MERYRTIKNIIPAQKINMGGIFLHQALPNPIIDYINPFILIHHGSIHHEGAQQKESGVGPHPHRGFSPVTFVFKGGIHHQDSLGNNAVITEGGTQWMHAGNGIVHSERPSKETIEKGIENEMIQFWVNTPAKYKMEVPYYLPMSKEMTPVIKRKNVTIAVVAGEFENVMGPAKTYSPQILLRVDAKSNSNVSFKIPQTYNVLIYLLDGELGFDDQVITPKQMIWFNNDGDYLTVKSFKDSRFIVLSGEPINEPIVNYGPFVMNTKEEIKQAINDYNDGNMGELREIFDL